MSDSDLLGSLYKAGLGHHLVMHRTAERVYLGPLRYSKGRIVIKDNGYMKNLKPSTLDPCWDQGALGMVCISDQYEWESITFYGLDECDIKVDLSSTRSGALHAAENQYGDKLIDFAGSIYRGFQLLLEHHFLPIVLLQPMRSKRGETGLVVSDLRIAPLDIRTIRVLNDDVTKSIEKYVQLELGDIAMSDDEFKEFFGKFTTTP